MTFIGIDLQYQPVYPLLPGRAAEGIVSSTRQVKQISPAGNNTDKRKPNAAVYRRFLVRKKNGDLRKNAGALRGQDRWTLPRLVDTIKRAALS